ncbi:hypothetical protein [Pseudomonas syringae]|uniref:Uncharacterized protein n=1 Tax=Pseudomonas syringae CC1417 TaxID=1357272 RepID=A0AAU8LDM3_PSESX
MKKTAPSGAVFFACEKPERAAQIAMRHLFSRIVKNSLKNSESVSFSFTANGAPGCF